MLVIVGAVANASGAPGWLVAVVWAMTAASALLSLVWMVPTCIKFERLAKRIERPR